MLERWFGGFCLIRLIIGWEIFFLLAEISLIIAVATFSYQSIGASIDSNLLKVFTGTEMTIRNNLMLFVGISLRIGGFGGYGKGRKGFFFLIKLAKNFR